MTQSKPLDVVVLVPTINNAVDLARCLAALAEQTYRPFRVLVVDGQSTDETPELVRRYGAEHFVDENSTRADACNHALRKTVCDIVVFTDDDCYPPPEWLANLTRHFERPEVAGVGGPHTAPSDQSFWGRVVDVVFGSKIMTAGTRYAQVLPTLRETEHNPGCNAAYRKAVLDEVEGFPAHSIGCEDVILDLKIHRSGYRLWFDPEAVIFHRRRDTWGSFSRQMRSYGRGRAHANAAYPELANPAHRGPALAVVGYATLLVLALAVGLVSVATGTQPWHLKTVSDGITVAVLTAPLWTVLAYSLLGWLGAILGSSRYRRPGTILMAPFVAAVAHVYYGRGYLRGGRELRAGHLEAEGNIGRGKQARGR
jgi:GT2 family glycosyltransferase